MCPSGREKVRTLEHDLKKRDRTHAADEGVHVGELCKRSDQRMQGHPVARGREWETETVHGDECAKSANAE